MVAEQAANRAAALPFQPTDEVDRADPVRASIDEIAEEPQACVAATPALGSVHEPGGPQEPGQHVAVAVDVAHDEHGRRPAL